MRLRHLGTIDIKNMKKRIMAIGLLTVVLSGVGANSLAQTTTLKVEMVPNVEISGSPGAYILQGASGLPTNWQTLSSFTLEGSQTNWVDYSGANQALRFYRTVAATDPIFTNPEPAELAWILPGTFVMGSPTSEALRNSDETQHTVTLTKGFYMSRHPVTQRHYLEVVGSNPSYWTGDLNRPVEQVSWNDATSYCTLLTAREKTAGRLPAGWVYRLPTESEWEYACRAGTTTAFHCGDTLRSGMANFFACYEYDAGVGNITSNATGIGYLGRTTPVGSYAPDAFGLYDMHGNVSQWCQDCYGAYPTGSVNDPTGPASGVNRVARGGGWDCNGGYCRSAVRNIYAADHRDYGIGFRVVVAPGQP